MSDKKSGWTTETKLILLFTAISFTIGFIYASISDHTITSLKWWERFIAGGTVFSIISGVVLRFVAAWSRAKTGNLVTKIDNALAKFRTETISMLTKSEYKSEMRFLRDMMQSYNGKNFYRFNFRFEGWDRLSIRLEPTGEFFEIRILGCTYSDDTKFYICEVNNVRENACPFQNGDRVACCQKGEHYFISKHVTDDNEMAPEGVFEFDIAGMPGQVRTVPAPRLASDVEVKKRLKDEAGISFFD